MKTLKWGLLTLLFVAVLVAGIFLIKSAVTACSNGHVVGECIRYHGFWGWFGRTNRHGHSVLGGGFALAVMGLLGTLVCGGVFVMRLYMRVKEPNVLNYADGKRGPQPPRPPYQPPYPPQPPQGPPYQGPPPYGPPPNQGPPYGPPPGYPPQPPYPPPNYPPQG